MSKTTSNGYNPLSAIDFLGLAKVRKVARLDLTEVGHPGVVFVRELSATEQARVASGNNSRGRVRLYNDKSVEAELSALVEEAGPKFMAMAMVTDKEDGAIILRAFEEAGPEAEYVVIPEDQLVQLSDVWIREAGNRDKMEKMLGNMGHDVTNLIVRRVRELSGIGVDRVEEKKVNS